MQAGRAPDLVYPNDGVLLPPNLGRLEFHFKPGAGNTLFELSFANPVTDVKVYLRCTALNGGCMLPARRDAVALDRRDQPSAADRSRSR